MSKEIAKNYHSNLYVHKNWAVVNPLVLFTEISTCELQSDDAAL